LVDEILENRSCGATIVGICGGYQMLGRWLSDPHGVESLRGETRGLDLLDLETTMEPEKVTAQARGVVLDGQLEWYRSDLPLNGYEIHMGRTILGATARPLMKVCRFGTHTWNPDGAVSPDGRVFGTYLHGIFDNDDFRKALLDLYRQQEAPSVPFERRKEEGYQRLAELLRESLDISAIYRILRRGPDL
jgi:adenosylcobyric acid synthase